MWKQKRFTFFVSPFESFPCQHRNGKLLRCVRTLSDPESWPTSQINDGSHSCQIQSLFQHDALSRYFRWLESAILLPSLPQRPSRTVPVPYVRKLLLWVEGRRRCFLSSPEVGAFSQHTPIFWVSLLLKDMALGQKSQEYQKSPACLFTRLLLQSLPLLFYLDLEAMSGQLSLFSPWLSAKLGNIISISTQKFTLYNQVPQTYIYSIYGEMK